MAALKAKEKRKIESAHRRGVRRFDEHSEIVGPNWRKRIGPKSVDILHSKKCPGARVTRKGFNGIRSLGIELYNAGDYNLAARGYAKEIIEYQNELWRQEASKKPNSARRKKLPRKSKG